MLKPCWVSNVSLCYLRCTLHHLFPVTKQTLTFRTIVTTSGKFPLPLCGALFIQRVPVWSLYYLYRRDGAVVTGAAAKVWSCSTFLSAKASHAIRNYNCRWCMMQKHGTGVRYIRLPITNSLLTSNKGQLNSFCNRVAIKCISALA